TVNNRGSQMVDETLDVGTHKISNHARLGRMGGAASVSLRVARAAAIAELRAQLEPLATNGVRRALVESSLGLFATIMKATIRRVCSRDMKAAMKLPDAKGLAAVVATFNRNLELLGVLPEPPVKATAAPPSPVESSVQRPKYCECREGANEVCELCKARYARE